MDTRHTDTDTDTLTTLYACHSGDGNWISLAANTPRQAAARYVYGGDWGDTDHTIWIHVDVRLGTEDGEDLGSYPIRVDPAPPPCGTGSREHEWGHWRRIVGGDSANPGVVGHGGGVVIHEVCRRCGCGCVTDTWATDPTTGEQGLSSTRYIPGMYRDEVEVWAHGLVLDAVEAMDDPYDVISLASHPRLAWIADSEWAEDCQAMADRLCPPRWRPPTSDRDGGTVVYTSTHQISQVCDALWTNADAPGEYDLDLDSEEEIRPGVYRARVVVISEVGS